ncbi:hypothetical protein Catovirus_2_5 [Catovirus CTV1]|uniref:Uncharacterized protein n=1 Tax=Catovirus CTV1 TaxID=1977631 RepID=A0A1V0SBI4_9VIRU|nr:hypothetical protein Catovirus_2_5 [Catovirus CTV1]
MNTNQDIVDPEDRKVLSFLKANKIMSCIIILISAIVLFICVFGLLFSVKYMTRRAVLCEIQNVREYMGEKKFCVKADIKYNNNLYQIAECAPNAFVVKNNTCYVNELTDYPYLQETDGSETFIQYMSITFGIVTMIFLCGFYMYDFVLLFNWRFVKHMLSPSDNC